MRSMSRLAKFLLLILLGLVITSGGAAYQFLVGFPTTFEGRRVHRVTVWTGGSGFQRDRVYYAYNASDGKEVKHGPFQRYENGHLVLQAMYRDGKVDGAIVYWDVLGHKTQEVYYHTGTPYGWANFAQGKLLKMRQEVMQDGRTVAIKTFDNDRYALEFNCGELINAAIDPSSGQMSSIANASRRACAQP
ncbi:MAG TPA: hypothetical protein VKH81_15680 [Candidatus Angelobacter sp.]|nr:hypothetical protein [Candidatus Angelobacter sp.]